MAVHVCRFGKGSYFIFLQLLLYFDSWQLYYFEFTEVILHFSLQYVSSRNAWFESLAQRRSWWLGAHQNSWENQQHSLWRSNEPLGKGNGIGSNLLRCMWKACALTGVKEDRLLMLFSHVKAIFLWLFRYFTGFIQMSKLDHTHLLLKYFFKRGHINTF